jgi:hypothetical protein
MDRKLPSDFFTEIRLMSQTVWKCEQVWAGQLYNRIMFNTREEAEDFVITMQQLQPDHTISIEAIRAELVWN